jgi:glycosyltransferase involved in cell wall biosynthesis
MAMTAVILDISRLISRVRYATPSGVDRVEMAYARGLVERYGKDLAFAAVHPTGRYGRIGYATALSYLDELERRWAHSENEPAQRSLASIMPWMARLLPRSGDVGSVAKGAVYVQTSPHHLTDGAKVGRILQRENARFVCMVHDLIPIEYPEYARPGGADLHRRRIETVTRYADAVIVNSAATGRSLQPWIAASGREVATHVAYLGTEPLPPASTKVRDGERPYLVCIGTIEGRKNHLLLLHLWRQMALTMQASEFPRLVIIGKRGWENAQVLAMLDRCAELQGHVEEVSGCSDTRLATLLRNAGALVMPSFAEGYGMPVAEALSVGVPVICSDIAAHREVGGDVPDFADPLDGRRWQELILDHAGKGPAWQAQMARIPAWRNPGWDEHMDIVAGVIEALAR